MVFSFFPEMRVGGWEGKQFVFVVILLTLRPQQWCSEITPDGSEGSYGMLGVKPNLPHARQTPYPLLSFGQEVVLFYCIVFHFNVLEVSFGPCFFWPHVVLLRVCFCLLAWETKYIGNKNWYTISLSSDLCDLQLTHAISTFHIQISVTDLLLLPESST